MNATHGTSDIKLCLFLFQFLLSEKASKDKTSSFTLLGAK